MFRLDRLACVRIEDNSVSTRGMLVKVNLSSPTASLAETHSSQLANASRERIPPSCVNGLPLCKWNPFRTKRSNSFKPAARDLKSVTFCFMEEILETCDQSPYFITRSNPKAICCRAGDWSIFIWHVLGDTTHPGSSRQPRSAGQHRPRLS